jgi:hypothetical protein
MFYMLGFPEHVVAPASRVTAPGDPLGPDVEVGYRPLARALWNRPCRITITALSLCSTRRTHTRWPTDRRSPLAKPAPTLAAQPLPTSSYPEPYRDVPSS